MEKEKEVKKVNVRVGDEVVVIAGKQARGKDRPAKRGKVLSVDPENNRCVVAGVNMITKHQKARKQGQKSEKKKIEGTIDISNVQIICPKCDKATRVANKEEDGVKHRICKKCGAILDKKYVKPKVKGKADDKKEEVKDESAVKKPLQRREVKHTAESTIKNIGTKVAPSTKLPRKMGGE